MAPLDALDVLPAVFRTWFDGRGWAPHEHQIEMLAAAGKGGHALLIAPTGGGKTLAGFLPSPDRSRLKASRRKACTRSTSRR